MLISRLKGEKIKWTRLTESALKCKRRPNRIETIIGYWNKAKFQKTREKAKVCTSSFFCEVTTTKTISFFYLFIHFFFHPDLSRKHLFITAASRNNSLININRTRTESMRFVTRAYHPKAFIHSLKKTKRWV